MKRIKYISIPAIVTLVLITGFFNSCKEEVNLELPYLFRPVNFNVVMNKTVATISWAAVDSATSYTFQLSEDSTYATKLVDTTLTTTSLTKELAGQTVYYARVRANAGDSIKNSKFNSTLTFTTPAENIFLGYGTNIHNGTKYSAYMTDIHTLTVKWLPAANVTHLIMTSTDGLTRDSLPISHDEAVAGSKVISNLANSNWYIKIFNNKAMRGKTYGLIEGDIVLNPGDDLASALTNADPNKVILLAGNATFPIGGSAYNFSKNVKVRSASPTNRSVVCMTAGTPTTTANMFGVVASSVIDSLVFENIDFTGYCDNNPTSTKIAYMYSNKVLSTVTNMKYVNCNLHNFGNTIMRVSNASNQVVENLTYNGCTINEIGFTSTYALVNSNSADFVNNINFLNCTIYNFKGSLILRTGQTIKSINVQNCNINQGMQDAGSARYLMDLNTTVFSGGVTLKNNIFGTTGAAMGANGLRYAVNTPITITGCYYTSDYVDDPNPLGVTSTSIKGKMTSYSGASTSLWNNPVNGDFSLKDATFAGKGTAGDLRW